MQLHNDFLIVKNGVITTAIELQPLKHAIHKLINQPHIRAVAYRMACRLITGKVDGMVVPRSKKDALVMATNWAVWAANGID